MLKQIILGAVTATLFLAALPALADSQARPGMSNSSSSPTGSSLEQSQVAPAPWGIPAPAAAGIKGLKAKLKARAQDDRFTYGVSKAPRYGSYSSYYLNPGYNYHAHAFSTTNSQFSYGSLAANGTPDIDEVTTW